MFDYTEEMEMNIDFPEKNKNRSKRRHNNVRKALRKQKLDRQINTNIDCYTNLHQYADNKITCNCPLCKPYKHGYETKSKPSVRRKEAALDISLKDLSLEIA